MIDNVIRFDMRSDNVLQSYYRRPTPSSKLNSKFVEGCGKLVLTLQNTIRTHIKANYVITHAEEDRMKMVTISKF